MTVSGVILVVFALLCLVHLLCEALRFRPGRYITKPLLMPTLGLFYVTSTSRPDALLIAALAFAWLGDVLLMVPDRPGSRICFKTGLGAFWLAHGFYIAVFAAYLPFVSNVPPIALLFLVAYLAVGAFVYRLIAPHAGRMLPAVIAYLVIIILMAASTLLPLGTVETSAVALVMAGAVLFMISDAVNAYNRFVREVPYEWFLIMASYLLGQFLLVYGYLFF